MAREVNFMVPFWDGTRKYLPNENPHLIEDDGITLPKTATVISSGEKEAAPKRAPRRRKTS